MFEVLDLPDIIIMVNIYIYFFFQHLYDLTEEYWNQVGLKPNCLARIARDMSSSLTWFQLCVDFSFCCLLSK